MVRRLKHLLRPLIPAAFIAWLKGRVEARFTDGPVYEITVKEQEAAVRCTVNREWTFLVPREYGYDLSGHGASRTMLSEFSGIARQALRGGVIFDVGAHVGIVSALFCAVNPANRVISFEPSPVSRRGLNATRVLNHLEDRMQIEPIAIGESQATIEMLVDPQFGFVQSQRFEHTMWGEPQKIEVAVESLPGASARLGVVPQIIKLDIEGYEYEAIKGAQAFLATHKPVLLLELHLNYLEERGLPARAVIDLLGGCGYTFFTYGGTPLRPQEIYGSALPIVRIMAQ